MIIVGAIFLLPRPLYRKVIKKKAVATMIDELDKQGGKLRYDLLYRLSENLRHVKMTALQVISNIADHRGGCASRFGPEE